MHNSAPQTAHPTGPATISADRLRPDSRAPHAFPPPITSPAIDLPGARAAVSDLLRALGVDPGSEVAHHTPGRVVASLAELLTAPSFELTTFTNSEGHHDLLLVRDIPFRSMCGHHLLPFTGTAAVAIQAGPKLVGLSKTARVVAAFAARLQMQENLTQQVADWLFDHLDATGVGVLIEAEHLCMSARGARTAGARTTSVAVRGTLRGAAARAEFLQLATS